MGLASALSTSLTGLSAAETVIDVVGNNLANSQTVGFKESDVVFATQFLQTLSLGSAPTDTRGGTNPRQFGLGTQVAAISPNFDQGTIQISANPADLAIQGDGFFVVQSEAAGEQLYTRNGIFKTNASNELINSTGSRLLGYGVDGDYEIQRTTLQPLTIPLGAAAVAQATQNVFFEGTLTPTGDLSTHAEILQTGVLGDSSYTFPSNSTTGDPSPPIPDAALTTATPGASGGALSPLGEYRYRIVYVDRTTATPGPHGETQYASIPPVGNPAIALGAGDDAITLDDLPAAQAPYSTIRIYRTADQSVAVPDTNYYLVGEMDVSGAGPFSFVDTAADATGAVLDTSTLSGTYDYYVVFSDSTGGPPNGTESRPSERIDSITVSNGRILLDNLPIDAAWSVRRIYRNIQGGDEEFHYVGEIPNMNAGEIFTDSTPDSAITGNPLIDLDGPRVTAGSLLFDLQTRDGNAYDRPFDGGGELAFSAKKGGRALDTKTLTVDATTTVGDLITFMEQAMGLQTTPPGFPDPIPASESDFGDLDAGGTVTSDGQLRIVANNGVANAIQITLDSMQFTAAGSTQNVNIPFSSVQDAVGAGAAADFVVYDSLGIPLTVRVTSVLESRTSTSTTYRWYADSPDNDPTTGVNIDIGTGLITFDGEGNVIDVSNSTVNILRSNVASQSPLAFELDFTNLSGLSVTNSTLSASRQDGSGAGVLSSFIIGEDGRIRGVFSNGVSRDLGQIVLARFANPSGLEQRGENLFSSGVNSGLPVQGDPGEQGIGNLVAGAVELSNTDVGQNLIDLILASSQYRSNTRVITTAQQLLDELLNLRR